MKVEASGFPKDVVTEDQKDMYIQRYYEKEGILLEKDKIAKNAGMRSIAKLMLNSFWGKFGQRDNQIQTTVCKTNSDFIQLVCDQTKEVSGITFINSGAVQIQWRYLNHFVDGACNVNPVIAAYTTAQARLKLYSYLEHLEERVLYFDTDSVIYLRKPGQDELPTGEFLGELTDEIEEVGEGAFISEFVSGGPKNYGYRISNAAGEIVKEVVKVKGITLNQRNIQGVHFPALKEMVLNYFAEQREVKVSEKRIMRTKDHRIVTRKVFKTWRMVYDKRQLLCDFTTIPWGYK